MSDTGKLGRPVEIHWQDTRSDTRWTSLSRARRATPVQCRTVGYVIKSTARRLVLAHTIGDKACDYTAIPVGCITEVIEL